MVKILYITRLYLIHDKEDLYETMLLMNEDGQKITIAKLADSLGVTPRTIHRHMCDELKKEKEILNEEINI